MSLPLVSETGLSYYLLTAVYDFHGHKFLNEKYKPKILSIMGYNENIHIMRNETETKSLIIQREKILSKTVLSPQKRDEILIHEFLGWVKTDRKHFLFAYFTGPTTERSELIKLTNWKIIHKDHLSLFHSHISKDVHRFYQMNSSDIPSTSDHNLSIDIRYIVNKWYKNHDNEKFKTLLINNRNLFQMGPDYLISLSKPKVNMKSTPTTPLPPKKPIKNESVMTLIPRIEEEEDPYEVKDESLRRVSKEEYLRMSSQNIDASISFDFMQYTEVSRRSYISKKVIRPESHYKHDPIVLFKAIVLATNIDATARRIGSSVPYKYLQIIENNDVTKSIDFMSTNDNAREDIKLLSEEFLYSLMAVENATRSLPSILNEKLTVK